MAATLEFPSNPSVNQVYSIGYSSWYWDGEAWNVYPATMISLGDLMSINIDGGYY